MTKTRAQVHTTNALARTVGIFIGDEYDDGSFRILRADGTTDLIDPSATTEPTIQLKEFHARALLQALLQHYHGGEDTRQLRKDYDAERARVDGMISVLAAMAAPARIIT